MTESWVYLFSKFTPEALLFEALGIFSLGAVYAGYWILKKRKVGAAGEDAIPGTVVRTYLNELIAEAEAMRAQLFGLLQGAQGGNVNLAALQAAMPQMGAQATQLNQSINGDPGLLQKVAAMEAQMAKQAQAFDAIEAEKKALETQLATAKAAAGGGAPSGDLAELQGKIAVLEARLAEYSIIEDDLANLKRLQQENQQLRAALGDAGKDIPATPVTTVAAAAPAAVATAAPPAKTQSPAPETSTPVADAAADPLVAADQAAQNATQATAKAEAAFEGLVDQVEQSLQPDPAPMVESPAQAVAEAAAVSSAETPVEKSDADLVEEFEKMLNA